MVTTQCSKAPPDGRPQTAGEAGTTPKEPTDTGDSNAVSKRTTDAIDAQRRTLQIADSMLGCLIIALEYSFWVPRKQRPDYPDAAQGIRRILITTINELDSVNLERSIAAAEPRSP